MNTTTTTSEATARPLIEVRIPDYDTSFTYGWKLGDLAYAGDNNKMELSERAQWTELAGILNAQIIRLNTLERSHEALVAVAEAANRVLQNCCLVHKQWGEGCNREAADAAEEDLLHALAALESDVQA